MMLMNKISTGYDSGCIKSQNDELIGEALRLMVVCHSYQYLQKDCTDAISHYFKNVDVYVRRNPFAEISRIIPLNSLIRYSKNNKISGASPSNVKVISTPIYYLPTDHSYKKLGEKHYSSVKIKSHNLTYDLTHCHFLWSSGYVGAKFKKETGTPLIVTAHGYDIYSLPFKDHEWLEKIKFVLNSANHVITVSKSNYNYIREIDSSVPVTVIPNGYKNEIFRLRNSVDCRKKLGISLNKKVIVVVGNLEPIKGHEYLIEAINIIVKNRNDILCVIIGSGSRYNFLRKMIREHNIEKYVIMVGAKPHDETALWMCAADVVALSSLKEGNPTVMFEALGCGKPFIGTKVGGIPEIINSDDYGLLVEPANPEDLAEKIMMALDREWDSEKILAYAEQFAWDSIAKQIIGVYRHILEAD